MGTKNKYGSKYVIILCTKFYNWGKMLAILGGLLILWHQIVLGAVILTIAGLGIAIIYFFSAFAPPREEVDWSLVYPELAGINVQSDILKYSEESQKEILKMKSEIKQLKDELGALKRHFNNPN